LIEVSGMAWNFTTHHPKFLKASYAKHS